MDKEHLEFLERYMETICPTGFEEEAARVASGAEALARAAGDSSLAEGIARRRAHYRAGGPWLD